MEEKQPNDNSSPGRSSDFIEEDSKGETMNTQDREMSEHSDETYTNQNHKEVPDETRSQGEPETEERDSCHSSSDDLQKLTHENDQREKNDRNDTPDNSAGRRLADDNKADSNAKSTAKEKYDDDGQTPDNSARQADDNNIKYGEQPSPIKEKDNDDDQRANNAATLSNDNNNAFGKSTKKDSESEETAVEEKYDDDRQTPDNSARLAEDNNTTKDSEPPSAVKEKDDDDRQRANNAATLSNDNKHVSGKNTNKDSECEETLSPKDVLHSSASSVNSQTNDKDTDSQTKQLCTKESKKKTRFQEDIEEATTPEQDTSPRPQPQAQVPPVKDDPLPRLSSRNGSSLLSRRRNSIRSLPGRNNTRHYTTLGVRDEDNQLRGGDTGSIRSASSTVRVPSGLFFSTLLEYMTERFIYETDPFDGTLRRCPKVAFHVVEKATTPVAIEILFGNQEKRALPSYYYTNTGEKNSAKGRPRGASGVASSRRSSSAQSSIGDHKSLPPIDSPTSSRMDMSHHTLDENIPEEEEPPKPRSFPRGHNRPRTGPKSGSPNRREDQGLPNVYVSNHSRDSKSATRPAVHKTQPGRRPMTSAAAPANQKLRVT